MFNKKQNEIDKLNARIVELARMVKIQEHNNYEIIKENEKVKNENADLRFENDELKDILRRINQLMTCNQYNNTEALRNKIIELSDMTGNLNR
mgnify:CR=1 FL=1